MAVQIARVTFLLALGESRLAHRPPSFTIPVYLGDSLQWNTRGFMAEQEVLIEVPDGGPLLEFPFESAGDPVTFASVIDRGTKERDSQTGREDGDPDFHRTRFWLQR